MTITADPMMSALTDLRPVSLDELVADAALQVRVDRKYVVPRACVHHLLRDLDATDVSVLEIDGQRRFGYRSVYFDTDDLLSFRSAGQGRRRRFKVRTRTYLDTDSTWLEVKVRGNRDMTIKHRTAHDDGEGAGLSHAGTAFVAHQLAAYAMDSALADRLHPTLVTAYRRSTLLLHDGERPSRATIDTSLEWSTLGSRARDLDRPGLAVIETKTGSAPSPMDRALWRHGYRPVRMSKYGAGLAALRPDLPRLKWHRTLHRHLTSPRRTDKDA